MKLDAEANVLEVIFPSWSLPDRVATEEADSSVRPPPRIWTVSKFFSVSNSENWKSSNNKKTFQNSNHVREFGMCLKKITSKKEICVTAWRKNNSSSFRG